LVCKDFFRRKLLNSGNYLITVEGDTIVLADLIYHHNIDPIMIDFGRFVLPFLGEVHLAVRWYGFAYLLAFVVGYWLLHRFWVGKRLELSDESATDFLLTVALSGVIGGRVGYVLLYGMEFFLRDPFYLFRIWEGGMSIHGGVVGAGLGIAWFAYKRDIPFLRLTDVACFGTPPGLFFGRIANFINGELWGRPTDGSWGVVFPRASGQGIPRHPSQLYEAVLEGPVLMLFLYWIYKTTDDDGYLTGGFLAGYGVLRFLVEFYRAPDPFIGYELFGMTRGQEYSLIFMLVGLFLLPPIQRTLWGRSR
jgi:phosphatidylglycerol:prolipoprotein diacylglycerol transferase